MIIQAPNTFMANSHPEPEERPHAKKKLAKPADDSLRNALLLLREKEGLSNNDLARELGFSASVISQYLNEDGNKYTGDVAKLERRIRAFLGDWETRRIVGVELIETNETRQVATVLETIRRMRGIGMIYGDAGVSKTSGIHLFIRENDTCIFITVYRGCRTQSDVQVKLFDQLKSGYPGNTKYWDHIVSRLKDAARLIIVDNAHQLTVGALQYLFDLRDASGVPVALVGNEQVLDPIKGLDQRFSRIGIKREIRMERPKELIRHLITTFAPTAGRELDRDCEQIAGKLGRYRAVVHHLSLAALLKEGSPMLAWRQAIRAAHAMLVSEVTLEVLS